MVIGLLAFVFMCPVMLPGLCSSGQQTCQSQMYWLLVSRLTVAVLIVLAWLWWAVRFPLPREYPLLLFRPPRLFFP